MNISRFAFTALLSLAALGTARAETAPAHHKVLIVVSGEGREQGKARPGYEFDELSQAWLIFRANGLSVEIASPQGGPVEPDRYNPKHDYNARLLADAPALQQLQNTRSTADLKAGDYSAIYVVGGKGAMFDLPKDRALSALLARHYEGGGIVAAVCHGPAALAEVRLADGRPLVAGKRMTGFSNEEEAVFGKRWAKEFPFLLEDAMRARGALWQEAALMMPKVVVDGRLITGQNPFSTPALAEAIVSALGRQPVARQPFKEEASMQLVQQWLSGDAPAAAALLATQKERYHVELIGMLGFYQFKSAADDSARRQALSIMELAAPHMSEPQLTLAMAQAHTSLGDKPRARALLEGLLQQKPDLAEARQALAALNG